MTIAATLSSIQYLQNGTTTQFGFPNKIFSAADLIVSDVSPSTPPAISVLALGTNYTVQNVDVDTGCVITLLSGGSTGHTLDIRTQTANLQSTSIKNQGAFYPELHEEAFDRLTREVQDLKRLVFTFGIHGPDVEITPWTPLPYASARANTGLIFDANGLPTIGTLSAQALTAASIGLALYPQTAVEIGKSVVPVSFAYQNGPMRYGATGNGVTDDSQAFRNMGEVGGYQVIPDGTYFFGSKVQTASFIQAVGWDRQNTEIVASAFGDFVLELGAVAGGPNPNCGTLRNLRMVNGTGANSGMLHVNTGSDLWRISDILIQSSACPAFVVDGCTESYFDNWVVYSSGYVNQAANIGAGVIIRGGCQNLYLSGLHIEQCQSGGLYVGGLSANIQISMGKIDQGFIRQYAAGITVDASSQLSVSQFNITGVGGTNGAQFPIATQGQLSLTEVTIEGGSGAAAAILDTRQWSQVNYQSNPTNSAASYGPTIPPLDLGNTKFGYAHPSEIGVVTPAAVQSKQSTLRVLLNLTVSANGSVAGNSISVQTSANSLVANGQFNNCYLVHNATGTQPLSRRRIIQHFTNGLMVIAGSQTVTLDSDWSIEYCGGHYTQIQADNIAVASQMDLFAVLSQGCVISGSPAYQASSAGAAAGTSFTITSAAFPAGTDATGYYLVDEVTGEAFLISYGVDGSGVVATPYNRVGDINTAHTFSIIAGHYANAKRNSTSYEWTFAGKKKTALIEWCDIQGFDIDNLPLWGGLTTGEPVVIPYSASMTIDASQTEDAVITVTNTTAYTFNNPQNLSPGKVFKITTKNASGGALGARTLGSVFKAPALTAPANGFNVTEWYRYDGTNLCLVNVGPSTVPN